MFEKLEELIEKHQCKKCEKCPCYWSDGLYSEKGCYLDECRACKILQKLFQFTLNDFSGCFIPLFIIKIVYNFESWQIEKKYKKEQFGA